MSSTKNYPELTVGAIIFNPSNEILLCKSEKWNNQYVIPGGHVEQGETLEQALRREVREETGLEIYDIEPISLQESIFSPAFHQQRHFIFLDFLCKTDAVEVVLNDEADSYLWAKPQTIMELDLGGYTRQFFDQFLHQKTNRLKHIFYQYV